MEKIELSLIIPVYNYQAKITSSLDLLVNFLTNLYVEVELIIVNDGSDDNTRVIIEDYLKSIKINAKLINLEKNLGKGAAVMSGFNNSVGKFKIFTDCDLAYPVSEVKKIYEALTKGADIAIANRRMPDSICELNTQLIPMVNKREKSGRLLNKIIRFLNLTKVTDTQAGLKGFSKEILNKLGSIDSKGFGFDIELLNKAEKKLKANIVSVPVKYQFSDSSSTVSLYADGINILIEIIKLKIISYSYEK